jgi:hypothetical protein
MPVQQPRDSTAPLSDSPPSDSTQNTGVSIYFGVRTIVTPQTS